MKISVDCHEIFLVVSQGDHKVFSSIPQFAVNHVLMNISPDGLDLMPWNELNFVLLDTSTDRPRDSFVENLIALPLESLNARHFELLGDKNQDLIGS